MKTQARILIDFAIIMALASLSLMRIFLIIWDFFYVGGGVAGVSKLTPGGRSRTVLKTHSFLDSNSV